MPYLLYNFLLLNHFFRTVRYQYNFEAELISDNRVMCYEKHFFIILRFCIYRIYRIPKDISERI